MHGTYRCTHTHNMYLCILVYTHTYMYVPMHGTHRCTNTHMYFGMTHIGTYTHNAYRTHLIYVRTMAHNSLCTWDHAYVRTQNYAHTSCRCMSSIRNLGVHSKLPLKHNSVLLPEIRLWLPQLLKWVSTQCKLFKWLKYANKQLYGLADHN